MCYAKAPYIFLNLCKTCILCVVYTFLFSGENKHLAVDFNLILLFLLQTCIIYFLNKVLTCNY